MFTSHSPRNITAKNNYNYNYVHGVDGNYAASLEVLSAGRELLGRAQLYCLVVGTWAGDLAPMC